MTGKGVRCRSAPPDPQCLQMFARRQENFVTFLLPDEPQPFRPQTPDLPETGFFTGVGAAFRKEANKGNYRVSREVRRIASDRATAALGQMDSDRVMEALRSKGIYLGDDMTGEMNPRELMQINPKAAKAVLDMAREEAKADPGRFKGIDLTDEGMQAEVNAVLRRERRDLDDTLSMVGFGSTAANLIGGMAGTTIDIQNLPFLLLGGGSGSFLKVMAREAGINVAAEVAFLPREFDMAERLNIEDPDIPETLLMAAAAGAVFGGLVEAGARALDYARSRNTVPQIEGMNPADVEALVEAVEEALFAGDNPLEAVSQIIRRDPEILNAPAAPEAVPISNLAVLQSEDLAGVGVDARTFQFKDGGDAQGVTDRLRGVTSWEPERAGVALIYEYADGRRVIVDGHQRLGLAKKLAADGQRIELPVRILREVDGITPAQARARAAIKNISEGSGTPLDAAKVLRDLGKAPADLNLPPNSALVRQGDGLSRLSNDAFGMVVNERATQAQGALVGSIVKDSALHADILSLVARLKPRNAFEAESIIRQADAAGATQEVQTSLFGDEVVSQSLYLERARVLDQAVKQVREDRATFNVLLERSERIVAAGNELDAQANAKRLQESGVLMQYVQRQANMKGPISDALTKAAADLKRTGKPGPAVKDFLAAVRKGIERGDLDGDARRAGRGETEPAPPPPAAEPVGSLFDLPTQTGAAHRNAATIAARQQQSRMGRLDQTRVESDEGGLFGGAQIALFDDPGGPKAAPLREQMTRDMRDWADRNPQAKADLGDGKGERTFNDALDDLDAGDEFAEMLNLCGRPR